METNSYWIHNLTPEIFQLGPLPIRWYGLMYVLGFVVGIFILAHRRKKGLLELATFDAVQDMVFWAFLGGLIGGRLGACFLYQPMFYLTNPLEILMVWKGGMASHGGILGGIIGLSIFGRKNNVKLIHLLDNIVVALTPGLFFGRIGNFINGELVGKVTNVKWAVIFPQADMLPRHPVQLYQALTEGLFLFLILLFVARKRRLPGVLTGTFAIFYSIFRVTTEWFREQSPVLAGPDWLGLTKGQIYTFAVFAYGVILLIMAFKNRNKKIRC